MKSVATEDRRPCPQKPVPERLIRPPGRRRPALRNTSDIACSKSARVIARESFHSGAAPYYVSGRQKYRPRAVQRQRKDPFVKWRKILLRPNTARLDIPLLRSPAAPWSR